MGLDEQKMLQIIKQLNPDDANLLELRWGLNKGKVHTLSEISAQLKMPHHELVQKLRKIEADVLSLYRNNT